MVLDNTKVFALLSKITMSHSRQLLPAVAYHISNANQRVVGFSVLVRFSILDGLFGFLHTEENGEQIVAVGVKLYDGENKGVGDLTLGQNSVAGAAEYLKADFAVTEVELEVAVAQTIVGTGEVFGSLGTGILVCTDAGDGVGNIAVSKEADADVELAELAVGGEGGGENTLLRVEVVGVVLGVEVIQYGICNAEGVRRSGSVAHEWSLLNTGDI